MNSFLPTLESKLMPKSLRVCPPTRLAEKAANYIRLLYIRQATDH